MGLFSLYRALKLIAQAELQLTFRCVGIAFPRYLAEVGAGRVFRIRVIVRSIQIGMVGEVECLGFEGQHVVVVVWNDMEVFQQGDIPALEARSIDLVARAASGKGSGCRLLESGGVEPVVIGGSIRREAFRD